MKVITFVSYLPHLPRNQDDENAFNFVKAVKGHYVGRLRGLDTTDARQATEWFGELAALTIAPKNPAHTVVLVPIPNSDCAMKVHTISRTVRLAQAIALHSKNVVVSDGLRWKNPMKPSHQGGTRDPQDLYDNLVLIHKLPQGTYVLVDDIVTKGNHILAAAAKISSLANPCCYAMCVARTVCNPQEKPFSITEVELPDFYPVQNLSEDPAGWYIGSNLASFDRSTPKPVVLRPTAMESSGKITSFP